MAEELAGSPWNTPRPADLRREEGDADASGSPPSSGVSPWQRPSAGPRISSSRPSRREREHPRTARAAESGAHRQRTCARKSGERAGAAQGVPGGRHEPGRAPRTRFTRPGACSIGPRARKERNSVLLRKLRRCTWSAFFGRFLRECFDVGSGRRVRSVLTSTPGTGSALARDRGALARALELPATCLRKPHADTTSRRRAAARRTTSCPYGVCTLRVNRSTALVQHIYGAIQEYGGFDEPRWLDGPPRKRDRAA